MINVQNIEKSYLLGKVAVPVLRNVSLEIHGGDFAVVAGPSGSGKTTLLNLLGCIDKPDAGRVILDGRDITDVPLPQLARIRSKNIGFIFQTFNLLPVLTAFENVEYPLLFSKMRREQRHTLVWNRLDEVGLKDHAHHRPDQLSGGQRQRVAIARALINEPSLILADEPTANLDSETGAEILDLLQTMNQETRITFVFASHDQKLIDRASRQIFISDGHIISDEYILPCEKGLTRC
jgi:putative ABC transport system ATP-binding protein